jgi:hypothetical protein
MDIANATSSTLSVYLAPQTKIDDYRLMVTHNIV